MDKTAGIDLGTNSLGLSVRDTDNGKNLQEQLDFFTSIVFKSGVGKGKTGEFSFAAERTGKRSPRRLYQARKYRIWTTLEVLIKFEYCPLSMEDLEKWRRYDKSKNQKRQYPVYADKFEKWVRLDFDGDGVADYSSPFQLRAEFMQKQFDFTNEVDRFKLGRALYHIAQRRGFRSSKGETLKEQELAEIETFTDTEIDVATELKKSEEKKSNKLISYMQEYKLKTIGCAFAHLENSGIRVRNSEYQAVRSQYKDEIKSIFEYQNNLDIESEFYNRIISEKKGEGTIFYKRPLRSQKGLVGKCTLEPNKSRCPISHPEFEKFRAWSFINNIQFRKTTDEEWQSLTLSQKQDLFQKKFLRTANNFKFKEIREWLQNEIKDHARSYILEYTRIKENRTINYKDNTNVSGCPISGRLKNLFGDNWEQHIIYSNKERFNKKTKETHKITYNSSDIWHICFSFDEADNIEEFAKNTLKFEDDKVRQLIRLWGAIQQGYGMLSLKTITNINRFLQKGLIYTDAVLLAKLPEIFKDKWNENEKNVVEKINEIIAENRREKSLLNIANILIANYKSLTYNTELGFNEKFAEYNTEYILQEADFEEVNKAIKAFYGEKGWINNFTETEQKKIFEKVSILYQQFFFSRERDYYHLPKLADSLSKYLYQEFSFLSEKELKKIYHPSLIEYYTPAKEQRIDDGRYLKLLGSPVIGALKNPMAMRVLHILRNQINPLLTNGIIDENTRMVVETARELNDANMRWAINEYQKEREIENKEYEIAITALIKDTNFNGEANPNSPDDIDKLRLWVELSNMEIVSKINSKGKPMATTEQGWKTYGFTTSKLLFEINKCKSDTVKKYRLWKEQNFKCLYTGNLITLTDLFTPNLIDFEHTVPRSISFDNSLSNLTVCFSDFNRRIKKNQLPSQLSNYDDILLRIQPWVNKVETLKDNVEFWKGQSKKAQDKNRKDYCIRQRHLWSMELEYWQKKVNAFTVKEVTSGFRNSQLNDTRIITKYAYHYLKTVFNKVEVQNGRYTSDFRKMLGVQSIFEKKDRDKHSHHAIDATVLTLIPVSARRDKMLELFYQKEEEKKLNGFSEKYKELENLLNIEIRKCGFGDISTISDYIEKNILVNHISNDQALTSANRRKRVRGKIVPLRDNDGKVLFEMNEDGSFKLNKFGHKIPKAKHWIKGDSIRGKLHGETFYGAITQAKKDENGSLIRDEDGRIQIGEKIDYVVRRELKHKKNDQDSGFKDWKDLENVIVDKSLFKIMKSQFSEGVSFKDACAEGIHMMDKKGNKVNKIRHIRCIAPKIQNPLIIKKHTYLSSKPYKQNYYADMGDLYVMCKYQSDDFLEKEFVIYSLFDVSQNRINDVEDIPKKITGKRKELLLKQIVRTGDMMLIYNERPEELMEMENQDLMKRLYVIRGFENDGKRIILRQHINAQQEKELGKGQSIKDFSDMPKKIRCGINTLKYLLINYDFHIQTNKIVFK